VKQNCMAVGMPYGLRFVEDFFRTVNYGWICFRIGYEQLIRMMKILPERLCRQLSNDTFPS